MTPEQYQEAERAYEAIPMAHAGKRCGLQHTPWMGDWFTSWSPRNSNSHAEGPWGHWVDLAVRILRDPMTALVRPDAHEAGMTLEPRDFYSEVDRELTDDELLARFTVKEEKG